MARPDPRHQEALDRFRLVDTTEADQRRRELEDLQFDAGDHWSDDAKTARGGSPADGTSPAVPPRPMPVIRALDQPIAQVINQARNARTAIKISPKSDGADQFTADVLGGLIRAIEYESRAQSVYLGVGAYQRAVIAGRGAARIDKEYASEEPGEWDQVLRIKPIINGASVYLDPWTQDVNDPAGPRWGFVTLDLPEDLYKRDYGKTALATADTDSILTSMGDPKNAWIKADTNGKPIYRISEYWFVEEDRSTETHPDDESQTRDIVTRRVMWAMMNGIEFIEGPQEWDGQFLPIPRIVGVEKNVGGQRIWEGMVRPNIGTNRMIDFAAATVMENMGLSTRGKWIAYSGQFEGHPEWDTANTRNWSKLEANPTTSETGTEVLPLPTWSQADPGLQPAVETITIFTNFLRSTTGVPDAALGNVNPSDRSGSAIKQLQQASEQGTSNYPDQLRKFIETIGHLLLDLIPKVYDRPGRRVHIMAGQTDEQSEVILGQPYVAGPDGTPQPIIGQDGKPVMDPQIAAQLTGGKAKFIDLTKGTYSVVVDIGKSFATRRQEAVGAMTDLAAAAPELLPKYADLLVKAMDIPESEAIAERLAPPGSQGGLPPEAQAAMQGMQQQIQQLQMMLATKQPELASKERIAAQQIQSEQTIAAQRVQADIAKAEIAANATMTVGQWKTDADNAKTYVEASEARVAALLDFHLERFKTAAKAALSEQARGHDLHGQVLEHAHERVMSDLSHQHATTQAAQSADLASQQAAQQAALAPPGASQPSNA